LGPATGGDDARVGLASAGERHVARVLRSYVALGVRDQRLHAARKGRAALGLVAGKAAARRRQAPQGSDDYATNLRRINKNGVLGAVTLHVPQWGATLLGCSWAHGSGGERVVLPRREWLDRHGLEHSAEIIVFDHQGLRQRFEAEALAAVKRLIRATTR
jgi:hypothetical protein